MMHVGGIMSTSGDVSVHWGVIMMHVWNIMSTLEGYDEYIRGIS